MGGELKSTFCLLKAGRRSRRSISAIWKNAVTHADYRKTIALYRRLFRFDPEVIAVDLHPDYLSTQWGKALAAETGARLVACSITMPIWQAASPNTDLHRATRCRSASCSTGSALAPTARSGAARFLVGGYAGVRRAAHFQPVALPGGVQAMRQPWRNTVAHLAAALGDGWRDRIADTPLAATACRQTGRDDPRR